MTSVSLSRPLRASVPSATPSFRPGLSALMAAAQVDAEQRTGHEAHVRQRAVAAADVFGVQEHLAEQVRVGDVADARGWVADYGEVQAGIAFRYVAVNPVLDVPEVGQEGEWLGRGAGLRRDYVQRSRWIGGVRGRAHGGRIGRIEDVDGDARACRLHHGREHRRSERRAAHAGDDGTHEALVANLGRERFERVDAIVETGWQIEPAEAVGDQRGNLLVARPDGCVACPDALDPLLIERLVRLIVDLRLQIGRNVCRARWHGHVGHLLFSRPRFLLPASSRAAFVIAAASISAS